MTDWVVEWAAATPDASTVRSAITEWRTRAGLADRAPGLPEVLAGGREDGWVFVALDGTLVEAIRSAAPRVSGRRWSKGQHGDVRLGAPPREALGPGVPLTPVPITRPGRDRQPSDGHSMAMCHVPGDGNVRMCPAMGLGRPLQARREPCGRTGH